MGGSEAPPCAPDAPDMLRESVGHAWGLILPFLMGVGFVSALLSVACMVEALGLQLRHGSLGVRRRLLGVVEREARLRPLGARLARERRGGRGAGRGGDAGRGGAGRAPDGACGRERRGERHALLRGALRLQDDLTTKMILPKKRKI